MIKFNYIKHLQPTLNTIQLCLVSILFCFLSCSRDCDCHVVDIPENNGTSITDKNQVYITLFGNSWPANAISDITLGEIHSEIPDFKLYCSAPDGYSIKLVKLNKLDEVDFYIYRIVCDMSAIDDVSPNNKNDMIRIPFTLTGTTTSAGKPSVQEYKEELGIQRFYIPESNSSALLRNWYLAQYQINENYDLLCCTDRFTHDVKETKTETYSPDDSPLYIYYNKGNGQELTTSCSKNLPGWIKGENKTLLNHFEGTFLTYTEETNDFGCSVYFINNSRMLVCKPEYSTTGKLLRVHRYTLVAL